jgi:hypothetical protein
VPARPVLLRLRLLLISSTQLQTILIAALTRAAIFFFQAQPSPTPLTETPHSSFISL